MNKLLIFIMYILCITTVAIANDVTLQWDPNAPSPDGYRLFRREAGQLYDYNTPIWDGTEVTVTDSNLGRLGEKIDYYWVVRAYVGNTESGDSNEVTYAINLIPPDAINNLAGSYNVDIGSISLSWAHVGDNPPLYWKVFYSEVSGGPYTELDIVQNTGDPEIVSNQILTVDNGTMKTFYFVIVSFKSETLFSNDSNEVEVIVDRRALAPITTLRIVVQ